MALLCDNCGFAIYKFPEFLRFSPSFPECAFCQQKMREIQPDVPSKGRIKSLSAIQRNALVIQALEACKSLINEIDIKSRDGKARAAMILDYARSHLAGESAADYNLMKNAVNDFMMYSQVAQNPRTQAVADGLIELGLSIAKDGLISHDLTHDILCRAVFANNFDKNLSFQFDRALREFEAYNLKEKRNSKVNISKLRD